MSHTRSDKNSRPIIRKIRVVTYFLVLVCLSDYYFIQPALITIDQLPPPGDHLKPLIHSLKQHVSYLASPELKGRVPGTPGNIAAQQYLIDQFKSIGLIPPKPGVGMTQTIKPEIGENIFAALSPSIPGREWLLLGAHFDHLGLQDGNLILGADDNASAVAILIATARLLQRQEGLKRFNILFVGFNAEEPPFFLSRWMGSHHFYNHLEDTGIGTGTIRLAVIMDLMGGIFWKPLKDTVFVMGQEKTPQLEPLIPSVTVPDLDIQPLGMDMIETIPGKTRRMFSDYQVFRANKVPFIFMSTGRTPHYHRPSDTMEKIHYARMARTVLWLNKLFLKLDRFKGEWEYNDKRQNLKQDLKTLYPLIEKASQWSTKVPQTGIVSLFKLKKDFNNFKYIQERISQNREFIEKGFRSLTLASIRLQCLLGKMGPCFLLPGGIEESELSN